MRKEKEMEKSRMYQFYELRDEMKKAIENSQAVEESEKALVAIIIASNQGERFKDFTKGISENWKRYESERTALKSRLRKVEKLIEMHEKRDESSALVNEVASLVLEAIGATKPESKKSDA